MGEDNGYRSPSGWFWGGSALLVRSLVWLYINFGGFSISQAHALCSSDLGMVAQALSQTAGVDCARVGFLFDLGWVGVIAGLAMLGRAAMLESQNRQGGLVPPSHQARAAMFPLDPRIAAQWHPTKNGQLVPADVPSWLEQKLWWKCSEGHEWSASAASRSRGSECPFCALARRSEPPSES